MNSDLRSKISTVRDCGQSDDRLYRDPGVRIAVERAFHADDYNRQPPMDTYYDRWYDYYSQPTQRVRFEDDYVRPPSPLHRPDTLLRARPTRPPSPVSYNRSFDPRAKSVVRYLEDASTRTNQRRLSPPLTAVRRTSAYTTVGSKSAIRDNRWQRQASGLTTSAKATTANASTTSYSSDRSKTVGGNSQPRRDAPTRKTAPGKTNSAGTSDKKLFLTANRNAVGLLTDNVYSVFNLKKRQTQIKMKTPWNMRLAVYDGDGERTRSTRTCTVYEYDAKRDFVLTFLRRVIKMDKCRVYSTVTMKTMKKTFGHEASKLKEDIVALGEKYQSVEAEPNRRSTVCLFRQNCKKASRCVFCKLDAMNNKMNDRHSVHITKWFLCNEDRNSLLDKMVIKIANVDGENDVLASSSDSSSSESSTDGESSSSESSSESSSTCSTTSARHRPRKFTRKRGKKPTKRSEGTQKRERVEETRSTSRSDSHSALAKEAPITTDHEPSNEDDDTGKDEVFLSSEIDWDPEKA